MAPDYDTELQVRILENKNIIKERELKTIEDATISICKSLNPKRIPRIGETLTFNGTFYTVEDVIEHHKLIEGVKELAGYTYLPEITVLVNESSSEVTYILNHLQD